MNANAYRRMRCFYSTCSVGMFGAHIYAFEQLTGVCDIPEYHQITREEYETAEQWVLEDDKVTEILSRPILCDRNKGGRWDFDEEAAKNSPWGK